jgi:hypothetical protein
MQLNTSTQRISAGSSATFVQRGESISRPFPSSGTMTPIARSVFRIIAMVVFSTGFPRARRAD